MSDTSGDTDAIREERRADVSGATVTDTGHEGLSYGPGDASGPEQIYAFADGLSRDLVEEEEAPRELQTWVTFTLAGEAFGLPVTAVREILRVRSLTRVPHAPPMVRGIVNMRGRVLSVVDLRVRLRLAPADIDAQSRILVVSSRGRLLGLLVDSAEEVASLETDAIDPPPPDVMTEQSEYIVGVYSRGDTLLILLDADRVLRVPDSDPSTG